VAPFKHNQQNPSPEVENSEIVLTNGEKDFSEGSFKIKLKKGIFINRNPVISSIINPPLFQISISINPQINLPKIIVLLGDTISDPKDRKTFEFPATLNLEEEHIIKAEWKNNKISNLSMDMELLEAL